MRKFSTGEDATLGTLLKWAKIFGDEAVKMIEKKINESPNGENEEVIADESQLMLMLASFLPEKEPEEDESEKLVCVLCGEPWEPSVKNRCECGGFCTWGKAKGAEPDSWVKTDKGYVPRPPPKKEENL